MSFFSGIVKFPLWAMKLSRELMGPNFPVFVEFYLPARHAYPCRVVQTPRNVGVGLL